MKAVFALVALLAAAQLASANDYKQAYAPKKYYTSAPKVTYVPEVVVKEKTVTDICIVQQVAITAPVVYVCADGYTLDTKTNKCYIIKKVCEDPKPVYKKPVYVTKGYKGGYGRKLQDDYKPKYHYAPKVEYVPKPVCKEVYVYADPKVTCTTGTLSGSVCIIGYKYGDCPKDFKPDTKDSTLCVRVTVIKEQVVVKKPVVVQKPKYEYVPKHPVATYGRRLMGDDGKDLKTIIYNLAGKFVNKYHKPEYKPQPKPEYKPTYPLCTVKYADLYKY